MEELPTRRRIRHPWWIAAVVGCVLIAGLFALIATVIPLSSEAARVRLIAVLSERLQGEVDLRELRIRAFPSLRAEGRGLTVRHHGRRCRRSPDRAFRPRGSFSGSLHRVSE